jgi:Bacterial regulatory proteins, gntR family
VAATKAELSGRIRGDSWREGLSVRALARRYGVHRRLVREALTHAEPAPRQTPGKPYVRADRGNHFAAWQ